ncbi:MAG: replicative DNA helicase [Clostridiales bacterium]|nr:replicative DNA helicase [Clostridiales bacterium]
MAENKEKSILTRVPPQNNDAEVAILFCCLDSSDLLLPIMSCLQAEDFYTPAHQMIFQAIYHLYSSSKTVDMITVGDELRTRGELEKIGGMSYLSTIMDAHALKSNYLEYIKIVRQKSLSRRIIKSMEEVTRLTYEGETDAGNIIEVAISRLAELRDQTASSESLRSLKSILADTIKAMVENDKVKAVRSHFSQLDYVTNGFRPGTLNIVAARPSMGKSAFVINIAVNVAVKDRLPVAFFSLEMNAQEIANRILASRCDISISELQSSQRPTMDSLKRINSQMPMLGNVPLYIDEHSGLNTAEILTKCRELQNRENLKLGLICIDYLQLMTPVTTRANSSRQQEVSDISRNLKLMAKELDVPIIALAQLSRESEKRDDHRPMLSDLRDSGAIEQDADMVMFIHRPDYYKHREETDEDEDENTNVKKSKFKKRDEEEIQKAMIIVAKNRQGPTKDIFLSWNGSRTTFFEKEKEEVGRPSDLDVPAENVGTNVYVPDELFGDPTLQVPMEDAGLPPMDDAGLPPMEEIPMPSIDEAPIPPMDDAGLPPMDEAPVASAAPATQVSPKPSLEETVGLGLDDDVGFEEMDISSWDNGADEPEENGNSWYDDPSGETDGSD